MHFQLVNVRDKFRVVNRMKLWIDYMGINDYSKLLCIVSTYVRLSTDNQIFCFLCNT